MTALSDQVAKAEADRDKNAADLTAAQAQVVRLQAELDALKPKAGMLRGANYGTHWAVDESLYVVDGVKRAQSARVYLDDNLDGESWATNSRIQQALADGVKSVVVSSADGNKDRVARWLDTVPDAWRPLCWFCWRHEPEPKITASAFQKGWATLSPVIHGEGCNAVAIKMGWTLYGGSKRNPADWRISPDLTDADGWDGYFDKYDPATLTGKVLDEAKAAGHTRLIIGETGTTRSDANWQKKAGIYLSALEAAPTTHGVQVLGVHWWNDAEGTSAAAPGWDGRLTAERARFWFNA